MKKNTFILFVWMFVCCVCTGCSNGRNKSEELNMAITSSPQTMDPQLCFDTISGSVLNFMCSGLYRCNEKMESVPDLAESYDVSDDGLIYTFHLREDLKWSDGSSLTAEDFVCAFQRLADPDVGSSSAFLITDACVIKNAAEINSGELPVNTLGVSSPDDYTFVVELEKPCPYFLDLLSGENFAPCNVSFYHSLGDSYAKSVETSLSSGPYILDWYEPLATQIHLTKNPYYCHADEITIPGVSIQVATNQQQALMAFEAGDIDITEVSRELIELAEDDAELHVLPMASSFYILLNEKDNPYLQNRNIRLAIAKSIDRDSLMKNVLHKGNDAMTRVIPPGFYIDWNGHDFAEDSSKFDKLAGYDPSEAKRLWEKGLKELGVDSIDMKLLYKADENDLMEAVAAQMERALPGLKIEKQVTASIKEVIEREKRGEYDMISFHWYADYADPCTFLGRFISTASSYGYRNPEYDEMYALVQSEEYALEPEKRDKQMYKAEEFLIEDMGIIPLYTQGRAVLVKENVTGYHLSSVGSRCVVSTLRKEAEE